MKRKIFLVIVALAVLALCLCACDETVPCKHEMTAYEVVEATCVKEGSVAYWQCGKCEKLFADEKGETEIALESIAVAAKGHVYGEWAVVAEATCAVEGSEERVCSVCNEKETRVVEKIAHTASKWIVDVEPTCTVDGSCHKECTVCGETIETEEILALGHTEVIDEAVAPTCEVVGKTEGKHCSVCKEILEAQKDVLALGHTEVVDKAVAATCTEMGLTEGKHCSVCEKVLVEQEQIVTKGHKFVDRVCTVCGELEASEGLEFALNADETAYIVTGIGTCVDADVIIPTIYNDLPVTAIGEKAFQNCASLKTVTIQKNIVSIAKDAFDGCENLTDIILK